MKLLYIECNMGAAGDMLMGALADLLPDCRAFAERMNHLGMPGVHIELQDSVKCGIKGIHAQVTVHEAEEESQDVSLGSSETHPEEHSALHSHGHGESSDPHEHVSAHNHGGHSHVHHGIREIETLIDKMDLPEKVKEDIRGVYHILAEAEASVHGRSVSEVHFHEVGTLDALADITGCALLIRELGADRIITSPVNVGYGQVRCAHGILPVPAPATARILEGIPCYAGCVEGELCTPTGAAILKYFTDSYGRLPQMVMQKTGYGMGKKDFSAANCVRVMTGEG